MTAKTAERQQRKHQKKRRQTLINTLNKLEIENCHSCPNRNFDANHNPENICGGCTTFDELKTVGNELDRVAGIVKHFKLPKELNFSTYIKLREMEWNKDDIRKHFNLKTFEFNAFLKFHEVKIKKG